MLPDWLLRETQRGLDITLRLIIGITMSNKPYNRQLFTELRAFNPNWQTTYRNLRKAVFKAAVTTPYILDLYYDFLATPEGQQYTSTITTVPDVKKMIEEIQLEQDFEEAFHREAAKDGY